MSKKRVIKDYDQMPTEVLLQLKHQYPNGYQDHLLRFSNAKGELVSALPFETEETFYLVRINTSGGYQFIDEELDEELADDFDEIPEDEDLELDESED